MPHDRNGQPLRVGDEVLVFCKVEQIHVGEEYCNVQLKTIEPMYPGEHSTVITLNGKQIVRLEVAAHTPEEA